MPPPVLDFEFYAGGIEDGIIEILTAAMKAAPLSVREVTTYSGELDDPETVEHAIAAEARHFPLVMVGYGRGKDIRQAATSAVLGRPLHYRHECTFIVVCADDNPLGERARRRSQVYAMIAKVRDELTGRRLKTVVEDEEYLLTTDVIEPESNEFIVRLPNITAYAVVLKTAFAWSSPDRTSAGTDVDAIIVGVDSINSGVVQNPHNLPGVTVGS